MRKTVDLPEELLKEAMDVSRIDDESVVLQEGLHALIRREKIKKLKKFKGSIDLDIDMRKLRLR